MQVSTSVLFIANGPVYEAALKGNLNEVHLHLNSPKYDPADGEFAMKIASYNGQVDIIEALLSVGCSPECRAVRI